MKNKNFNTGIYQIVNLVNGKRYIGSALKINQRKNQHFIAFKYNRNHNIYLQRAYNKYGKNNFKFEILLYCSKLDLTFYEQRAIDAYDFKILYNISPTAGNCVGVKHSEQSRINMSEAHKGKTHSPEQKAKISKIMKNRIISEEHRRKLSVANKGRIIPEYEKIKMKKNALRGEKNSRFNKHGKDNPLSKAVYQIDKNTNEIIKEWESIIDAKKGLMISHISEVCNGKEKLAGGFKWAFVKDYENKKGEQNT